MIELANEHLFDLEQEFDELLFNGKFDEARKFANNCNQIFKYHFLSKIHRLEGNMSHALKFTNKSLKLLELETSDSPPTHIPILSNAARCLLRNKKFEKAQFLINRMKEVQLVMDTSSEMKSLIDGLINLSDGLLDQFQNGLGHTQKLEMALLDLKKVNSPEFEFVSNRLGLSHYYLGNYDKAMSYYDMTMEICERYNHSLFDSISLQNKAIIYHSRGEIEKAIDHYERSLVFEKQMRRNMGITNNHHNLAGLYRETGQFEVAITMLEKNLRILQTFENDTRKFATFNALAEVYLEMGNYKVASNYMDKSIDIQGSMNNLTPRTFYICVLLHLRNGNYQKSEDYLNLFEKRMTDINGVRERQLLALCKSEMLLHQRNYQALAEAEKILTTLINDEIYEYRHLIRAYFLFINLKIDEMDRMDNVSNIPLVKNIFKELEKKIEQQNSSLYLFKLKILYIKLHLVIEKLEENPHENTEQRNLMDKIYDTTEIAKQFDSLMAIEESRVQHNSKLAKNINFLRDTKVFHPTKIGILNLLSKYHTLETSEMRNKLKLNWGQITSHIESLEQMNTLRRRNEFVDTKLVQILELTPSGRKIYEQVKENFEFLFNGI